MKVHIDKSTAIYDLDSFYRKQVPAARVASTLTLSPLTRSLSCAERIMTVYYFEERKHSWKLHQEYAID